MARRGTGPDPKEAALAEARCLNPHPEQVTDPEFLASDFFDARDAVQVKYEMVRAPLQKPRNCPPARCGRRITRPCLCSHHLATRLLNQARAWMPARPALPAAGSTPATSNSVMPPCTHAARRSGSASACWPAAASPPGGMPRPG
jgi:hypothetical protein